MSNLALGQSGGGDTIGDWSQSLLIRFIRDFLDQQPIGYISTLKVDTLAVTSKLILQDLLTLTNVPNFIVVGATGAAPFTNSWVAGGSPDHAPAYWKDPLGFIHLRGSVKNGTVGAAAFTLPPGFRPPSRSRHAVVANGAFGIVDVLSNGQVIPQTSNVLTQLDGIHFRLT